MVINLKILFKNTTKYNGAIYIEFLQFHEKKYGLKYTLYTILIIVLLLFLVIMQIKFHRIDTAIIICFVITCFFLWRYFHPASEVAKDFKSEKIQNEQEFTFLFYEKHLKVRDKLQSYRIKYHQLYKVFETPTFFYLYLDKTHSLLLNKETFSIGSSDEFSDFIRKKCWYKFKKDKKK